MNKSILFTYDYELFLGTRSGTVNECILKPTSILLKVLNRHSVRGIFFVDTIFLLRLQEEMKHHKELTDDYKAIVAQLREIVENGHYIFPHIHAHWLDAVYLPRERQWDLSNIRYYKFSSLGVDKQIALFDSSINLIDEIIETAPFTYDIDAYRAGGWSIQPFSAFKTHFIKHHIKYDFSVIAGKKVISRAHSFDFSAAPKKNIYKFKDLVELEDKEGPFVELSISSVFVSKTSQWIYFKLNGLKKRMNLNTYFGNGSVVEAPASESSDLLAGKKRRWVASMEGLNFFSFLIFFVAIIKRPYFQFISHPKLITPLEIRWLNILLFLLRPFRVNTDYKKVPVNA